MAKVDIDEALLKKYSDKELIHYVATTLRNVLEGIVSGDLSTEAAFAVKLTKIGALSDTLIAVDRRMNKDSKETRFMV